MFPLTTQDVSFCFVKFPDSSISLGIKYHEWLFSAQEFLNSNLKLAKAKINQWLEDKDLLRIVLEKDCGFYLCEHREELETVKASIALRDVCKQMWISSRLKKRLHHRSWRLSEKCLSSQDVTDWIVEYLKVSRTDAIKIGKQCVEKKLFNHVYGQNYFSDSSCELYRLRRDLKISKPHKSFILTR